LLSALNANLYGASRMIWSLGRRGDAPAVLGRSDRRNVPIAAVVASVSFGFAAAALELAFPQRVLPVLLNIVGATCLLVWTLALVSQFILRRRANRANAPLPFRMRAFPVPTLAALAVLAVIFAMLVASPDTRAQFLSMAALTLAIAGLNALAQRLRRRPPAG